MALNTLKLDQIWFLASINNLCLSLGFIRLEEWQFIWDVEVSSVLSQMPILLVHQNLILLLLCLLVVLVSARWPHCSLRGSKGSATQGKSRLDLLSVFF